MFRSALLFALTLSGVAFAQPAAVPTVGLPDHTPNHYLLTEATVWVSPGRSLENASIVVKDGRVIAVGDANTVAKAAEGAEILKMTDMHIYAGFIDAYSDQAVNKANVPNVSPHWNKLIRPQYSAAAGISENSQSNNASLRKQGFVARLIAPRDGILKGASAITTTGDSDDVIVKDNIAQHLRLTSPAHRDRTQYPNSPMGAVALARQTMLDSTWYRKVWQAHHADPRLPKPETNLALAKLANHRKANGLFVADTINEQYLLRADLFAREFGLPLAIVGSGLEYRRLDAVKATGRTIILPISFPKPPNVASTASALDVSLRDMMHWELAPENPARLARAEIPLALTTKGLESLDKFWPSLRKAMHHGWQGTAAHAALTTTPAELFGVTNDYGVIAAGKSASFVIADGDLFPSTEKGKPSKNMPKIIETWVDGERYQHQSIDNHLNKTWQLTVPNEKGKATTWNLKLVAEEKKLKASLSLADNSKTERIELKNVGYSANRFSGSFAAKRFGKKGFARISVVLFDGRDVDVHDTEKPAIGVIEWPDGSTIDVVFKRIKSGEENEASAKSIAKDDAPSVPFEPQPKTSLSRVNYPFGAYGRNDPPTLPKLVLFTNATIWTCSSLGVIENGSVLIGDGKIIAVFGADETFTAPPEAIVVNLKGKHITPGIIDCHSHMATDGGVNESAQAVTAEVRIGDFIDGNDIAIYRQLAGGVTTANVLHGSANPIGGQNQVIKLRWGALPEALKMREAPPGIKFALGENVKQSNWGEEHKTRYPQTRMGVVEIMKERLQSAREYTAAQERFARKPHGLPPRRDLELDAIAEIVAGKRWIHCHSYRQDEILALLRTLEEFDITIGTLQHILEGYKVADAMAKHGAMGSSFSDWWAYKFEVYDAIPYNGAIMHRAGVVVSFNSDDRELARHLNQEAAKAMKYGGVSAEEALKFVTLNPARQLRIDQHVGSLEAGKQADLVVWSAPPLSTFAACEQTWIDGRKYFDREEDAKLSVETMKLRAALVQKILASGEEMLKEGERQPSEDEFWPRHDAFCHHGDHDHDEHHSHTHENEGAQHE